MEAALTLPLMIFLIIGTLQLFLMLQGRIMAEYAAFRATRAGSLSHGNCKPMQHAAILALLPSFYSFMGGPGGRPSAKLAAAFRLRIDNKYSALQDGGYRGDIVWITRARPLMNQVPGPEDREFDSRTSPMRMETRLVYFFPLKMPVVNWLISQMVLANWGWKPYSGVNPLMVNQNITYEMGSTTIEDAIRNEVLSRYARREYVLPIHASGSMRMMTPARRMYFQQQNCSGTL